MGSAFGAERRSPADVFGGEGVNGIGIDAAVALSVEVLAKSWAMKTLPGSFSKALAMTAPRCTLQADRVDEGHNPI